MLDTLAYMHICAYGREVDDAGIARGAELLKVLANPVRCGIIVELQRHEGRCVHELVAALEVSQPLMSQHLRVLRSARLIAGERSGKEIRYSIVDEHVVHIVLDAITHAQEAMP
jgi:ArsR family transcriptional regulator, zinc-responsive transcriptional repressor